ncbi:MAG: ABC transporter ATP-binding protein [Gammaproteobacteria bacterium]|nr:ABC transporter ATP-binding protein [Gammaproteobacteria bacterium]
MTTTKKISSEPVIEVQDLVAHYGSREVLHGINLSIHDGEIMVIMGGSGSGKSTVLRHMLGLNTPSSGAVKLLGQDITRITSKEIDILRRNIGVSFQGGALFNSMTVGENIILPLREHTQLDEKTMQIMCRMKLELVSLAGFEDLMPAQLSGGMVKRAALARAIIMDPKLLFFDEPSAGLDPVVSAELDELILRIRQAMKTTIVVVTHELDSTFRIADRITVLDEGNVLMVGTVDEVRNSKNKRIMDLLGRRVREIKIDAEEYLNRLTGEQVRETG